MDSTNTVAQPEGDVIRNSLIVPADLWRAIKKLAIDENRPANAVAVDSLRMYLKAARRKGAQ